MSLVVNEQSLLTKGSRVAAQSIRAGARQMSSATEAEAKGALRFVRLIEAPA